MALMRSSADLNSAMIGSSIGARNRPTLSCARCQCIDPMFATVETHRGVATGMRRCSDETASRSAPPRRTSTGSPDPPWRRALMHAPMSDEVWDKPGRLASWEDSDSLSAWEGGRCVGNVGGYRLDTLVPGGAWLPTCGVTRVGVLSTHRRRGLLRSMLPRLLAEAAGRGQVLASLRASETRIYQPFGFGLAGRSAEATMTSRDALPTGVDTTGSMRLLRHDEILPTVADIYERIARRPGVLKADVDVAALPREGHRARWRRRVRRSPHVRRRRRRRVRPLQREVGRGAVDAAPRYRRGLRPLGRSRRASSWHCGTTSATSTWSTSGTPRNVPSTTSSSSPSPTHVPTARSGCRRAVASPRRCRCGADVTPLRRHRWRRDDRRQ